MSLIESLSFGLDLAILLAALGYVLFSARPIFGHIGRILRMVGLFVMSTVLLYFLVLIGVTALTALRR